MKLQRRCSARLPVFNPQFWRKTAVLDISSSLRLDLKISYVDTLVIIFVHLSELDAEFIFPAFAARILFRDKISVCMKGSCSPLCLSRLECLLDLLFLRSFPLPTKAPIDADEAKVEHQDRPQD